MRIFLICVLGLTAVVAHLAAAEEAIGNGAFRDGASLRLAGQPGGSLLERLRELEYDLTQTRAELAARDRVLVDLKRNLDEERARTEALSGKVQFLDHARISLETARQEVTDRGHRIAALELQLAGSELARLRAERFLFEVAGDLLGLEIGDAGALSAIQGRLRTRVATSTQAAAQEAKP